MQTGKRRSNTMVEQHSINGILGQNISPRNPKRARRKARGEGGLPQEGGTGRGRKNQVDKKQGTKLDKTKT